MIDDVEQCRRTQKDRRASRCFPLEIMNHLVVEMMRIRMASMMKMASVENDSNEEEEKEEDDNNKDNGNDED